METLHIGIASYEEMKARTIAIARGELKPRRDDPKVWVTSAESLAKILSGKNRALLETIRQTKPESLEELAEKSGRHKSNLSRTLKTMEHYGLVAIKKVAKGRIIPTVNYRRISVSVSL